MTLDLAELAADWRTRAACLGLDDLFIFEGHNDTKRRKAAQICRACPVLPDCTEFVESHPIADFEYGVWAGSTIGQRRRIKSGLVVPPVGKKRCDRCGTVKDRDYFSRHRTSPDGLRKTCVECVRAGRQPQTRICIDCGSPFSLFLPSSRRRCPNCVEQRTAERRRAYAS